MLTGPIYMLQVYDRVLGSGSVATLVALTSLVAFLYGIMGLLDHARGRIMARAGARFQASLDRRVFDAVLRKSAGQPQDNVSGLRDLEAVQRFMISPVVMALFDMPWVPIFLLGIALFHPWLGYLALGGGAILVLVTLANQIATRVPVAQANQAQAVADGLSSQIRTEAEMVQALGMRDAAFDRWQLARDAVLTRHLAAADLGGGFGATSKSLRLFLQSAMLGLGAWLVIRGEISPGAMIAASILLGRALAPIEQAIGNWPVVQRAMRGWTDLAQLLSEVPPEAPRTPLPVPRARLDVQGLTIIPPGERQPVLRMLGFTVEPGQAVGVIGPSGAGKSTLARALTGAWPPVAGKIRLDGAALDQYSPAALGQHIGYLPQGVQLFDGTIAENIARMSLAPDAAQVVAAARKAAAHEMILKLPDGYDTRVSGSGGRLSGGQIQRIGLARAMYGDPVILVLDEPNSNLDNEGSQALNSAIRAMKAAGRSVLIMAHRPAAIQECDMILMLDG
ncbi:MAG: type I secretion system permease/ATPase, partial [Rhodobacterales bacterium]|nr:type I secretion system permease/ATPase [Rhodobacterales bacterium]MDX5414229.1 type I secretion system permease/ATPase [Rhodobacterales bacterium]